MILFAIGGLLFNPIYVIPAAHAVVPGANGLIAFTSDRDGNREIYVMDPSGSGQTNLTDNPAWDMMPAWSPDGTKIAFSTNRDGDFEIYVMNADGSGQTNLSDNAVQDFYPAWSPDGTKIAYQYDPSSDGTADNEIYLMNPDGSGLANLSNNHFGGDGAPAWSPDGTKIAFVSDRGSIGYEIYVMNADGTGAANLTNNSWWADGYPAWSPDGSKIAFFTDRDGNPEIYVMNADGSAPTDLTNSPASDDIPSWQALLVPPPRPGYWNFVVELNDDAIWGGGWIGPVDIAVTRDGTVTTFSDVPVDYPDPGAPGFGWFQAEYKDQFHFLVGDVVTVTDSDGSSRELVLTPIEVTVVNVFTDVISGTCSPQVDLDVRVSISDLSSGEIVPCDADGTFNANGLFDVREGDNGGALQSDTDGDGVQFSWWVPRYDVRGFFSPVDNAPLVNKAKAGQTIPVKWFVGDEWRMGDPMFGPISDPMAIVGVSSRETVCQDLSGEVVDAIETYVSDPGTLQYVGDGNWQFNWRTQKVWTGQCRTMTLTLSDGTTKTASFSFR